MKLLLATHNRNKIIEIENKFNIIPDLELLTADIYPDLKDIPENGESFKENAIIKALAFTRHSGLPSLADDSGLVIDALDGRPGIYSARYGGKGLNDTDRNRLILEEMKDVEKDKRTARFVCVVAICIPDGNTYTAEGSCEGIIHDTISGEQGFGYDPIFYLLDHGCTMAQIPLSEKNMISHRAAALDRARKILIELAGIYS